MESETWAHVIENNTVYQAHFEGVLLNSEGWVVNTNKCLAVRNGGCEHYQKWRNYNKFKPIVRSGHIKIYSNSFFDQAAIHNNRLYEKVISISQSRATWHYTMENLLGLAAIDLGSLRGGAGKAFVPSVLHITSFSPYTMQWLQVVRGGEVRICSVLDPSHVNKPCMSKTTNTLQHQMTGNMPDDDPTHYVYVISGIVLAKKAIVPEMGRCGHPSVQQLMWLRDRVNLFLSWHAQYRAGVPKQKHSLDRSYNRNEKSFVERVKLGYLPNVGGSTHYYLARDVLLHELFEVIDKLEREGKPVKLVILTTRKRTRKIENEALVRVAVKEFATTNNFLFYEHTDVEELPVVDQLRLHRLASIVVGPHGGAEVSLIAMRPRHSCVIELIDWGQPWCYARVARTMQLNYIALGRNISEHDLNVTALNRAMSTCQSKI